MSNWFEVQIGTETDCVLHVEGDYRAAQPAIGMDQPEPPDLVIKKAMLIEPDGKEIHDEDEVDGQIEIHWEGLMDAIEEQLADRYEAWQERDA